MPPAILSRISLIAKNRQQVGQLVRRHRFHAPGGWRKLEDGTLGLETYVNRKVLGALSREDVSMEVLENATDVGRLRQVEVGKGNRFATRAMRKVTTEETYLNVDEVESALERLADAHPDLTELVTLPHKTARGRTCHALRVGAHRDGSCPTFLVTGGVHAREWGSCEIVLHFVGDLLNARANGTGLVIGGFLRTSEQVRALLDNIEIVAFPDVNPDGRKHSQERNAMWRKNRRPVRGAIGVDVNRNFDFLWDFKQQFSPDCLDVVATSDFPRDETYCGTAPFSEAETQNVRWLLDTIPHIGWFVDLHSYGELIMYNWGDDENQSNRQNMSFCNPAYDSKRGIEGDARYREFIPAGDLALLQGVAHRMRAGIQKVRGRPYTVQQSFDLYPTSGTSDDYAYSRHFADPTKPKVRTFCVEWGTEFMPPWSEMVNIIKDLTGGLVELCEAVVEVEG